MKQYILIQNDGEIETNSFELIGASTKRNQTGKIGFFGSGLKYSIAYMMRNNIEFRIFSGETELKFTTMPESLKEQTFDRICINGKPTSYTVTMGPTWKEDWFVLREIYCNAIDEGTCQLIKGIVDINPSHGKTRIFIELTESLKRVIDNWDAYFSDEREPMFVTEKTVYVSGLGNEDGDTNLRQKVTVYKKTDGVLFRKGIRVLSSKRYLYDYGFDHVNINEDRTAKNPTSLRYVFLNMAAGLHNENWLKSVLRTSQDDDISEEYLSLSSYLDDPISDKWIAFSHQNLLVVKEVSGKYQSQIMESTKEVFLIPSSLARNIKKQIPEAIILGMGSSIGDAFAEEIEATPKMNFLLKEVTASLKELGYEVPYEVVVASFERNEVLGRADLKNKKIVLADKLFDMGRREIAVTLMEETEHIKSGCEDETRAFQNHIFSQWLKSMENQNGIFL